MSLAGQPLPWAMSGCQALDLESLEWGLGWGTWEEMLQQQGSPEGTSGTSGGHLRWLNLSPWDSRPCPSWLGLCSHRDAGLAALSAGLWWRARCPLHWLPVTRSLPGTQEEDLAEPRERPIPSGKGCQQKGSPRKWLTPALEAQAGEGWGQWPLPTPR